jgi:3-deoxy-D-arabino-heptulosonate 7-phosphate (DAHP) synthase
MSNKTKMNTDKRSLMINKIIIAGPCAAETREQVLKSAKEAKKRGVKILRASLWKPRTEPGFDGVKEEGIPWLVEVAQMGLTPGTEVLNARNTKAVLSAIAKNVSNPSALIWIGARNQNHDEQVAIARAVKKYPWARFMFKNQPWRHEKHWRGILKHVLASKIGKDKLFLSHRGFDPGTDEPRDPKQLRNFPDYPMAMRIKTEEDVRMIIDPSHMGGTVENVIKVTKEAMRHKEGGIGFDGFIFEVHPDPKIAWTDAKQQLTWEQFDELMEEYANLDTKSSKIKSAPVQASF